ncbi:PEP-utilizing enzyme [Patulibacter sp. NPDC049589]|uniref:PEP-utilizing enzyme n=1 Tax=Patulibacter sp. NPDC049589 TaxID=3154731 RepID=UPI00341C2C50
MASDTGTLAARGTPTIKTESIEGNVVDVRTPDQILGLLDMDLTEVIVLIHTAGASMLAPVFGDLRGVLCTVGGPGAHVAIISREFGVPCVVALDIFGEDIVGRRVRVEPSGEVHIIGD